MLRLFLYDFSRGSSKFFAHGEVSFDEDEEEDDDCITVEVMMIRYVRKCIFLIFDLLFCLI